MCKCWLSGNHLKCNQLGQSKYYPKILLLQTEISGQKTLLAAHPDIVIATPSTVLVHLISKRLVLKESLQYFVIDEADLIFSFGFEEDLKSVLQ